MPRTKPALVRLCDMTPGQSGDFFALLIERTRGARRDGKPFFTCRFRDTLRTVTFMVWRDGDFFELCEKEWQEGKFFKIRGVYQEHPTYGPQIDPDNIRLTTDDDKADGFDPLQYVERSRYDIDGMYQELW